MGEGFCEDDPTHVDLLRQLWDALLSPRPFPHPPVPSADWKLVGFQRDRPDSDLRGAGVLGLRHIVFLATQFTPEMLVCIERQKERTAKNYPVATACISITTLVCILLGITKAMSSRPWFQDVAEGLKRIMKSEQDVSHFHARLFLHMDREYVECATSSYLTFNDTMEAVREDAEEAVRNAAEDETVDGLMELVSAAREARLSKRACCVC